MPKHCVLTPRTSTSSTESGIGNRKRFVQRACGKSFVTVMPRAFFYLVFLISTDILSRAPTDPDNGFGIFREYLKPVENLCRPVKFLGSPGNLKQSIIISQIS